LFFRPPTFKKHIFKEVDECNGTITNFHKVLLILVIFGTKESNFSPNNRYFGGLAILTKSHIRPHVKIQKNTNPDFQWIKLEKSFLDLLHLKNTFLRRLMSVMGPLLIFIKYY
jgi:hypothetical protein